MLSTGAIIAAAGIVSRQIRFTPLLPVGDSTMIRTIVQTLVRCRVYPIVVVTGYRHAEVEQVLSGLPVELCHNAEYATTKMSHSLRLGYEVLRGRCIRAVEHPSDEPLYREDTLNALLASNAAIIQPTYQGTAGHPLLIHLDRLITLLCLDNPNGLRGRIRENKLPVQHIEVDDPGILLNGENAEKYRGLLRYNAEQGGTRTSIAPSAQVSLHVKDAVLDASAIQFLELIGATNSIHTACASLHMSYSKAWKLLQQMEECLGYQLVSRTVGGSKGGSSSLTPRARQLIARYQQMDAQVAAYAQRLFAEQFASEAEKGSETHGKA